MAIKAEADRHAANVLPIIREAQKVGATSLREIAAALNARGVATARGGQWHAKSVANVLERVGRNDHACDHWGPYWWPLPPQRENEPLRAKRILNCPSLADRFRVP